GHFCRATPKKGPQPEKEYAMNRQLSFLGAFGLGLGAMSILDPNQGRRRRAPARDKTSSAAHHGTRNARKATEDVENRGRALQGGRAPARTRFVLARETWSPSVRLLAATTGGGALAYGLSRGGLAGKMLTLGGSALLLGALTNLDAARLTGIGAGCRAIDLR